jgi:hypothetical protein
VGVGLLLALLVLPNVAYAGCAGGGWMGAPDIGACIDAVQYNGWRGLALFFWQADQALLIGAHQFDQLRWFLVDQLFLTLYQALVAYIDPLLGPLGILALTLAALGMILVPVFGSVVVGSVRQVLIGLVLIPLVFAQLGPWVVEAEHARSELASDLFGSLPRDLSARLFGQRQGAAQDMQTPKPLEFTACGDPNYAPRSGLDLQDAAAGMLWADWKDIACPQGAGSEQPLFPARWSRPPPDGPGYLYPGDVGDINDANERSRYIQGAQQALARATWALIPCLLAQLEAFIQFVFSLCMVILTLASLLTFLATLFQKSFSALTVLIQGAWQVLKVSVMVSGVLALLTLCLLSAAQTGSAQAYLAFAGVSLFVTSWLLTASLLVLKDCFLASSTSVGVSAGLMPAPTSAAVASLRAGAGLMASGATSLVPGLPSMPNLKPAAVAAGTALAAGTGVAYAAGYGLSHMGGALAKVGGLAAAMRKDPGERTREFKEGLQNGGQGRRDPLSPQALQRVRDYGEDRKERAGRGGAQTTPGGTTSSDAPSPGAGSTPNRVESTVKQGATSAQAQSAPSGVKPPTTQPGGLTEKTLPASRPVQPLTSEGAAQLVPATLNQIPKNQHIAAQKVQMAPVAPQSQAGGGPAAPSSAAPREDEPPWFKEGGVQ